ncbi:MAG: glycosyltransferase, partial [Candidatus Omnitrophica bacterium]|nr:glycosyltransferase [Candidatus Omnitrophota bacterium]
CDIVLLSYESPRLLRECVESVLEHTRVRSRLIIVDNGSRDPGVASYLNAVHGNDRVSVEKVFSEENAGFAAGMNKGLRLADAPYICWLNNDCVVTEGWLEEMIKVASAADNIGLVNPQSNTFGSDPDTGATVNDHAALLKSKSGSYVETGHVIGFACLMKKELLDRIGYLDEGYEGVCYEDTDYSLRAAEAGYIPVVAEAAYVLHREQASRKDLPGKEEIYRKNRLKLEKKWGKLFRLFVIGYPPAHSSMAAGYDVLVPLARRRCFIDVLIENRYREKRDLAAPERRRKPRHADISYKEKNPAVLPFYALWKVITKKKKYNAVFVRKGLLLSILRVTAPLRGISVLELKEGFVLGTGDGREIDLKDTASVTRYLRGAENG